MTVDHQAIREGILSAYGVGVETPVASTKSEKDESWLYFVLIGIVVLVSVFTLAMLVKSRRTQPPVGFSPPVAQQTNDVGMQLNNLRNRVGVLEDRQWVLGLAHNESAIISQRLGQRIDPTLANKYPILDEQWRLNKMPEFLRLTDAERQSLSNKIHQ